MKSQKEITQETAELLGEIVCKLTDLLAKATIAQERLDDMEQVGSVALRMKEMGQVKND